MNLIRKIAVGNERGQGLTEYIILLLLIAVISIVATRSLGTTIRAKIQEARNHINSDLTLSGGGGGRSKSGGFLGGILGAGGHGGENDAETSDD